MVLGPFLSAAGVIVAVGTVITCATTTYPFLWMGRVLVTVKIRSSIFMLANVLSGQQVTVHFLGMGMHWARD